MIPHDTKGVNLPPEPTAGLTQTLLERRGGPFAHEQLFAVITPVNDVITPPLQIRLALFVASSASVSQ